MKRKHPGAAALGRLRWKGKTKKERAAYARMMYEATERAKRLKAAAGGQ